MTYLMLHKSFRQDLINFGLAVGDSLLEDLASPELPYPALHNYDVPDQITKMGYAFEEHSVTTGDGYILTAFRVPGKLGEPVVKGKQTVLMQHGLLDDGGTWFFNNASLDLSLELVDRGYDVWVTNSRGSAFSNTHVTYTTKDKEFWDFSFHEMGKYDVPSNLQYIRQITGIEKIIYVGHS